jgi:UDP-GlcNAc:undecaprenyl-phosphate/decaprenyl-phosphate GlcNAc-1-phosphate transferase
LNTYLAQFFLAALLALLFTPRIRALGNWLRAYGSPHDGRPLVRVPRLGGLAIVLALLSAWGLLFVVNEAAGRPFDMDWRSLTRLLLPAAAILAHGVYDDLVGAAPVQKLLVESAAAGILWWGGVRMVSVPILGYSVHNSLISLLLTTFWVVAVVNSFNLIDGLDGLAAGVAFLICLTLFVISSGTVHVSVRLFTIPLAGALLGFLKYNFAPANVYLGETGSHFLGFFLAGLAIVVGGNPPAPLNLVVPYVAFGLPLFDCSVTVARRLLGRKPLFVPDQNHIHHRLLLKGHSTRAAVMILYALTALSSIGSLFIFRVIRTPVGLLAVLAAVAGWFLCGKLKYEEFTAVGMRLKCVFRMVLQLNLAYPRKDDSATALRRTAKLGAIRQANSSGL